MSDDLAVKVVPVTDGGNGDGRLSGGAELGYRR